MRWKDRTRGTVFFLCVEKFFKVSETETETEGNRLRSVFQIQAKWTRVVTQLDHYNIINFIVLVVNRKWESVTNKSVP